MSPCGDLAMSPRRIVEEAKRKRLDMIGICDHNSAENVEAVARAARDSNVAVIPGIEVTTEEEVHILGLFDSISAALEVQERVYQYLDGENDPEVFGMQPVVDENAEVLSFNPRLLIGATRLSVSRTVETIHGAGGVAIASHVDRKVYSLISQLGFVPLGLPIDGLEITGEVDSAEARRRFDRHGRYEMIRGSDAHRPEDIGSTMTAILAEKPDLGEISLALHGKEGRRILHEVGEKESRNRRGTESQPPRPKPPPAC
jgi:predicted metal-dependent phosphoesterase TrpH